jgi:hypothetical protein
VTDPESFPLHEDCGGASRKSAHAWLKAQGRPGVVTRVVLDPLRRADSE